MAGEYQGSVVWRGGMAFEASAGSGGSLILDASPDLGGANRGPRPMELLLLGLAGCTGMSVLSVLRRSDGEIVDYRVSTRGTQRHAHPRVFTTIEVEHRIRGRGLTPDAVDRAVLLAATRFCPVAAMLGEVADVVETWLLLDDATGAEIGKGRILPGDPAEALDRSSKE